jgi:hypothetical protein
VQPGECDQARQLPQPRILRSIFMCCAQFEIRAISPQILCDLHHSTFLSHLTWPGLRPTTTSALRVRRDSRGGDWKPSREVAKGVVVGHLQSLVSFLQVQVNGKQQRKMLPTAALAGLRQQWGYMITRCTRNTTSWCNISCHQRYVSSTCIELLCTSMKPSHLTLSCLTLCHSTPPHTVLYQSISSHFIHPQPACS